METMESLQRRKQMNKTKMQKIIGDDYSKIIKKEDISNDNITRQCTWVTIIKICR